MPYVDLGSRSARGAADLTGRNPGNWTVVFDPALINVNEGIFECHKMIVTGGAPTSTFTIYRDLAQWDTAVYGALNSWDAYNPLQLRPGQYIYFFYSSLATDGFQPQVTIHMRYDPSLRQLYGIQLCPGKCKRYHRLCYPVRHRFTYRQQRQRAPYR